ncbi:hypothetical protein [Paenibacillus alkalitolerans]|uniref:hypothetical protein n=1 Tax=Paenibacillus alkalitolerans TaxID=2799335 RepID=UPI0018F7CF52|nr:hypothetical protein [Paenibacillus alkalitolerans]
MWDAYKIIGFTWSCIVCFLIVWNVLKVIVWWRTTRVPKGDCDPAGNDNIRRKIYDYM